MNLGAFGYPTTGTPRPDIAAPEGELILVGQEASEADGGYYTAIRVLLDSVPAGAVTLHVICLGSDWQALTEGGKPKSYRVPAVVGTTQVAILPRITETESEIRYLRMAFCDVDGGFGKFSRFTTNTQFREATDPTPTLAYNAFPSLVVGPDGLVSGETVGANQGSFEGDTDNTATLTLWSTDASSDNPASVGVQITPFTFDSTLLTAPQEGLWLWVRGEITDGTDTVYGWSTTGIQVLAPPVVGTQIVLLSSDVSSVDTLETTTDGLWQAVLRINTAKVNPNDTNIRIRTSWTRVDAIRDNAIASYHPVIGGDEAGFSPLLTALTGGASYTKANGYWRVDRRADQENVGGTYENPWALKEGRQADNTDPRRGMWLWQVSRDAGVTWDPYSADSFFLVPDAPNPVDPPDPPDPPTTTGEYWKSLERGGTQTTRYGFGIQYCRSWMICEDKPDYFIGGGDMNGIRLSKSGGETFYHAESEGLRCPGFNSVAIDPVDPNYLLALGNMVWLGGGSTRWHDFIGIWRSTDFGKTWTQRKQVLNNSQNGFSQSNFCYDPASRGNAASARTWFLVNMKDYNSGESPPPPASAIEMWKSTDGGASWGANPIWTTTSVSTYGRIYKLRCHPTDGTMLMATSSGLWRSSKTSISWSRVGNGLPSARVAGFDISPAGQKIYALVKDGSTLGLYYSANNGGSWAKNTTITGTVRRVAVNYANTSEVVFVGCETKITIATAPGAGGTWTTATQVDDPGRPGGTLYSTSADGFDTLIASTRADTAFANVGAGRVYLCSDKASFVNVCWGYTGVNAASGAQQIAVHPSNKNKWGIAIQDAAVMWSEDNGQHFKPAPGTLTSINNQTGYGFAVGSSYSIGVSSTNSRILVGYGEADAQCMAYTETINNNTPTWTANTNFTRQVHSIWRHPTASPEVFGVGFYVTKNAGQTVAYGLNGRIVGVDSNGAGYMVRTTNGTSSDNKTLYKSTNWHSVSAANNVTYTEFYSSTSKFEKFGLNKQALVSISRATTNLIWVAGANSNLYRVVNTGTTFGSAVPREIDVKGYPGVPTGALFELTDIHADPNDPDMCYVSILGSGYAAQILRVQAGASGAVTFTNITANVPKFPQTSVHVLPHTGDVIAGGGTGVWCYPAPAGYKAANNVDASIWPTLAVPINPPAASTGPDAFTASQWTLTDATTGGALTLNITGLVPGTITSLQYRIGTGSAVTMSGTSTGARTISGLTNGQSYSIQIRAITATGTGAWSTSKSATPTLTTPTSNWTDSEAWLDALAWSD